MIFTYRFWEAFCKQLHNEGIHSVPAKLLMSEKLESNYLVLKHDVETNVANALHMAEIESKWGHRGSYYVQAYLLEHKRNVAMLIKMQKMGHEISYHHDVMDAHSGDIQAAALDFKNQCSLFEANGFAVETVCQHGNPVVERKGYASNRDFFRNESIKKQFPKMADIMVNFKEKILGDGEYLYFSDAGRKFQLIYDPINNDLVPSDDKNIPFDNLYALWKFVKEKGGNVIISTHPHRWCRYKIQYVFKTAFFKTVRAAARIMVRLPFMKRLISKYFYLAKKI